MQSHTQHSFCLFRTIILSAATALLVTLAAPPMPAQTAVPPTAVEAARMPQFAAQLARPTHRPPSGPSPALGHGRPPQGGDIYDNGPINGTINGWTINFGFVVSDTMTIGNTGVSGMSFGAWLYPGDILESAEVSITSEPNGGTFYYDQTVNFTQGGCFTNGFDFNVCTETSTNFNGPNLAAGTYWVNLQNAVVSSGDPVQWDENNGPSQAYESSIGTIPSESFTMFGDNGGVPPCFRSQGNLQIIHDFTQQDVGIGGAVGLTIDNAGNLYGTTWYGGNNGAGFAYKLARFAEWLLDPIFSFSGDNNGNQPAGVIVGPNGSLYGGAQGGIQNCGTGGSQYCGLVFNLQPRPTACPTTQCNWNEKVPYRFSTESDGTGTINISASDQLGNLYGVTSAGGTFDQGTVFELTPFGGGWTKTTLYNFTGGNDSLPTQVLLGNDGNLYGVTYGLVFQLTSSGGRWTESVLHDFQTGGGSQPAYLVQDSAGNLFGIAQNYPYGTIFTLQKKNSGWTFNEHFIRHGGEYDFLNNLAIDAAGKIYGTGAGGVQDDPSSYFSYIFKAGYDSRTGWHYEDLDYLGFQEFSAGGSLALDTSGNLYGTTYGCGSNNAGTVWQLSP